LGRELFVVLVILRNSDNIISYGQILGSRKRHTRITKVEQSKFFGIRCNLVEWANSWECADSLDALLEREVQSSWQHYSSASHNARSLILLFHSTLNQAGSSVRSASRCVKHLPRWSVIKNTHCIVPVPRAPELSARKKRRRGYRLALKAQCVMEVIEGRSQLDVARDHRLPPQRVSHWCDQGSKLMLFIEQQAARHHNGNGVAWQRCLRRGERQFPLEELILLSTFRF
jgi:hypothetical protein